MTQALLNTRSIIRLCGADARNLLQGIVTNNITLLDKHPAIFSAMLSPQGKFQHDFFIVNDGNDVLLDTQAHLAEALIKKLKMYRLRSDVTITDESEHKSVLVGWNEPTPEGAYTDPRLPALGWRMITNATPDKSNTDTYNHHRLELAIPEGSNDATDRTLIMENGYDQLHAIAFDKGCYVGQEVTARMHYRNALPKCLFKIQSSTQLPPLGTAIKAGDKTVGEMRSSSGTTGLALIRLSEWQNAQATNTPFTADEHPVSLHLPDYMEEKIAVILNDEPNAN